MNKINFSYKFNSKKDDIIYLLLEGSILLFIKYYLSSPEKNPNKFYSKKIIKFIILFSFLY